MQLSFVETMRGWMRDEHGEECPVSFELVAIREHHGLFEVRGLLAAPPLVVECPARGTLEMKPGSIRYHLEVIEGGRRLFLDAEKHPSIFAPLRSMTRMPATIKDDSGRVLASGEMRFETRDLVPFLASWLPLSRHARLGLDTRRRTAERRLLSTALVEEPT